jgi:hypothetical protein
VLLLTSGEERQVLEASGDHDLVVELVQCEPDDVMAQVLIHLWTRGSGSG